MRARTELAGAALATATALAHVAVVPHLPLWSQLAMVVMVAACLPCVASLLRSAVTGEPTRRRTWVVVMAMGLTMLALHAAATGTEAGTHAMHDMHGSATGSAAMAVATAVALAEVLLAAAALVARRTSPEVAVRA